MKFRLPDWYYSDACLLVRAMIGGAIGGAAGTMLALSLWGCI